MVYMAIGAPGNDGNGENAGHVRIYEWSGTNWIQKGIDIDGEAAEDYSGSSVSLSLDGNLVAIGAGGNDGNGEDAGHVRIYEWSGTNWIQKGIDIDGEAAGDYSGSSVSLSSDGNIVAIGATFNDGNGENAGHVRIYEWNGSAWIQKGIDIDGEAAGDESGRPVSLSSDGNTVAIGAPGIDRVKIFSYGCAIDVSLTDSSPTLSANQTGATYQWLDCNNGYSAIIGETSQSFTATANGSYAVEISIFGCVDTSECIQITEVVNIENTFGSDLVFYPNPTFDYLNIELGTPYSNIYAKVISINGQVVKSKEFFNTDRINLMIEGPPGYYIVEIITSDSKRAAFGIVKE